MRLLRELLAFRFFNIIYCPYYDLTWDIPSEVPSGLAFRNSFRQRVLLERILGFKSRLLKESQLVVNILSPTSQLRWLKKWYYNQLRINVIFFLVRLCNFQFCFVLNVWCHWYKNPPKSQVTQLFFQSILHPNVYPSSLQNPDTIYLYSFHCISWIVVIHYTVCTLWYTVYWIQSAVYIGFDG